MKSYISQPSGTFATDDDQVSGPLVDEIVAGTNITISEVDAGGGNKKIQISASGTLAATDTVKSENATLVYNGASGIIITGLTARVLRVLVNVETAFNGSAGDAVFNVGDDTVNDRLVPTADIDLYTAGEYIFDVYHEYGVATNVEFYYTRDSNLDETAGALTIEVLYVTN